MHVCRGRPGRQSSDREEANIVVGCVAAIANPGPCRVICACSIAGRRSLILGTAFWSRSDDQAAKSDAGAQRNSPGVVSIAIDVCKRLNTNTRIYSMASLPYNLVKAEQ